MSFDDLPVNVGPVYEGERIRANQMFVELGGPKQPKKFEFCQVKDLSEVTDGQVTVQGPDLTEMEEEGTYPIGIHLEVAGSQLETDLEAVFERRIHEFLNYIEGLMHLNQRNDTWIRIAKTAYQKGLNTLKIVGTVLIRLFKAELSIIEAAQVTFYTSPETIADPYDLALATYETRDARARGMKDEDVEEFYGCVLCQSFAPTHCCCITPNRISLCGSINWFDARAAAKVDPNGPIFKVEKGECLDELRGEYTGINEVVQKRSLGEVKRVNLFSALSFPHTSCGCFEAIVYYIPEVEGFGVVDRNFKGNAPNGLPFSSMANSTGGGKQSEGFCGVAIEYMRSPKFLQADGGWERIVWLPSAIKERVATAIPDALKPKIATENEAQDIAALKTFLKEKDHPVVKRWVKEEAEEKEEAGETGMVPTGGIPMGTMAMTIPGAGGMGGIQLILKNCKIHAESIIIKKMEPGADKKKK
ncbi:MAG TPA: CO dehydrogenase/CO-methylating acetyl-CoA synthase complex subunit beta [Candidatus Lokiarchaeia archaeon]|nr:CO dehydrogenase/CO-methylating acetyl-CoA synthase complex subunit beta [Candidatus Lokiarchaeia archaeon]